MRMLTASIVIGSLVLIGALPAGAGQSTLAPDSGAPVRLAAGADSTADRDTYTRKAREEMQEWQQKLHDFSEKAAAKGKQLDNAAKNDLNKAWAKAKALRQVSCRPRAPKAGRAPKPLSRRHPANWRTLGTRFAPRTSKRPSGANLTAWSRHIEGLIGAALVLLNVIRRKGIEAIL